MATVDSAIPQVSKMSFWFGTILSWLPALFILFTGVLKLIKNTFAVNDMTRLGYAESMIMPIAIMVIAFAILYLIPQTSVLGAILLSCYLGAATGAHMRINDEWYFTSMGLVLTFLLWTGLYMKDHRLRELIPFKK